jgi:hypothetical protein
VQGGSAVENISLHSRHNSDITKTAAAGDYYIEPEIRVPDAAAVAAAADTGRTH